MNDAPYYPVFSIILLRARSYYQCRAQFVYELLQGNVLMQ
jgi:hypothetical protein